MSTQNLTNQSTGQVTNLFRQVGTAERHGTRKALGAQYEPDAVAAAEGGILYGKPAAAHSAGTAITYNLFDRNGSDLSDTVDDVYNGTTQPLVTTVLHFIFQTDGGLLAFPAELAACTATNPTV